MQGAARTASLAAAVTRLPATSHKSAGARPAAPVAQQLRGAPSLRRLADACARAAAQGPVVGARRGAARSMAMATGGAKKRALVSVFDKTELTTLAKGLAELGFEVVSTGGSATALEAAGVAVTRVEALTSFPEMLDGRVKTLHPAVHGGILARRGVPAHMAALQQHSIGTIDVVVCNLYPFRATALAGKDFETTVENIDIGGPAMIRAAAKNHGDVFVVVDPADYVPLLAALQAPPAAAAVLRKRLAWKAFQHVASYDSTVAEWFWTHGGAAEASAVPAEASGAEAKPAATMHFPPALSVPLELAYSLRYGENPHQAAAFYRDATLGEASAGGVASATLHHGKEMSYNNFLDADAAYNCVTDFVAPSCVVVKHTNPCGVASRPDLREAYRLSVIADPISAFGGIVAFNRPVDEALAKEIREFRSPTDGETRMFYEIVIAPGYTKEGLECLKGKSKTLRILEAAPRVPGGRAMRQVAGGWLLQQADELRPEDVEFKVVSAVQPTAEQLEELRFAWRVVKHVKSNAITVSKGGRLLGMGSGQPNRVNSTRIALEKAGAAAAGAVLASDAFFPFAWGDSVELACQAGIKAIAHPGGSIRDQDAVDCCNKYGVALVTTGVRHFRH